MNTDDFKTVSNKIKEWRALFVDTIPYTIALFNVREFMELNSEDYTAYKLFKTCKKLNDAERFELFLQRSN